MIKLLLVHRKYYPTVPFLPWQHGSLAIEKLFGIGRAFIPNFTYVEFLVMLRHIMAREAALQRLATVGVHQCAERTSGYVFDTTFEQLTDADLKRLSTFPTPIDLRQVADVAWDEVLALLKNVSLYFLGFKVYESDQAVADSQ